MEPCSDTKGASEIASGATDKNAVGLHAITCKFSRESRGAALCKSTNFLTDRYQNSWAFLFRSPFVANESSGGPAWQAHRHRTHPPTHITIRTVSVQCAQTRPSSPPCGFVVSILEFRVINYYSIVYSTPRLLTLHNALDVSKLTNPLEHLFAKPKECRERTNRQWASLGALVRRRLAM